MNLIWPEDQHEMLKCSYVYCLAGMGLAGSGSCFEFGMWWHPSCPCFQDEEEIMEQWRLEALCSNQIYN